MEISEEFPAESTEMQKSTGPGILGWGEYKDKKSIEFVISVEGLYENGNSGASGCLCSSQVPACAGARLSPVPGPG